MSEQHFFPWVCQSLPDAAFRTRRLFQQLPTNWWIEVCVLLMEYCWEIHEMCLGAWQECEPMNGSSENRQARGQGCLCRTTTTDHGQTALELRKPEHYSFLFVSTQQQMNITLSVYISLHTNLELITRVSSNGRVNRLTVSPASCLHRWTPLRWWWRVDDNDSVVPRIPRACQESRKHNFIKHAIYLHNNR